MHIRRLIPTTIASLWFPCAVLAIDLPPIDKPMPFGTDFLGPVESPEVTTTSPRTVDLLAAELTQAGVTRERRARVAMDLGVTDLETAVGPLVQASGDAEPIVRSAVAAALGNLKRPGGVDAIVKLASDSDTGVRTSAVVAAAALGRGDLVTAGLNDADASVVSAALSVATTDQASAITARLNAPDKSTRLQAVNTVARLGLASASDEVAKQLSSDDVAAQVAAIEALTALKASGHGDAVVGLLKHEHPTVRRAATLALPVLLSPADAQSRSIAMLADTDETVSMAAAQSLAKVPGPAAVDPLVRKLSDPYHPLRTASRAALVAIGQPAVPSAVRLLDDADPNRRIDGSYLLGMLASREGFDRHLKLLEDPNWAVVAQAAESLGRIGDPAAGDALVALVKRGAETGKANALKPETDAIWDATTNALLGAAQLGHKPIGPVAAQLIPERLTLASEVRAAAIWVVGVVGVPNLDGVVGRFPGYIGSIEETPDVKIEAVKAVGNLKYSKGLAWFKGSNPVLEEPVMLAIIHWSKDRIAGQETPFELQPFPQPPDVGIRDIKQ
jgi:HEAT repeat protein